MFSSASEVLLKCFIVSIVWNWISSTTVKRRQTWGVPTFDGSIQYSRDPRSSKAADSG